jgi:hypothetical protein
MNYKLAQNNIIVRDGNTFIPSVTANQDYQEYLKWLNADNTPLPADKLPVSTWEEIKQQRDSLLVQSDWATLPDATPKPNKEAWLNYRQALRDITKTFSSPESVVWPIKPS